MELCTPWIGRPDCPPEGATDEERDLAALIASQWLFARSGFRYRGVCTETVSGCRCCDSPQWLQDPTGTGARPLPYGPLPCGCQPVVPCANGASALELPGYPIIDVEAATIGGVPVTGDLAALEDRWLLLSGQVWGTDWEVTYRYGSAPPAYLAEAARVLACELLLAGCADCDECQLPQRLQQIVREGITATVLDPFEFLDGGRFGIYAVDNALVTATWVPPQARVLSTRDYICPPSRHVRPLTLP